ncbi:MAG: NAD(P)/FAD-dependent oxidoreductase [Flavobacteriales bacterium]
MGRVNSDVIIAGGGIAGLVLATALQKEGLSVLVLEAGTYPRHKVCGEFISTEVLPYLHSLQLPIDELSPVRISRFQLSSTGNRSLQTNLDMQALGISRFALDDFLKNKAESAGVHVVEETEIVAHRSDGLLEIAIDREGNEYGAPWYISAHGKRSRMDTFFERKFLADDDLYSGIKMHFEGDWSADLVALHNFKGGYAGISAVENKRINLCYLVKTSTLKELGGLLPFQEQVMRKNKALDAFFSSHTPVFDRPLAISGIRFGKKEAVAGTVAFLGDATGLVAPLFGNGMALAVRTAHAMHGAMREVHFNPDRKSEALQLYAKQWKHDIQGRLALSRSIQGLFGRPGISDLALMGARLMPLALHSILAKSHNICGNILQAKIYRWRNNML